MMRLLMKTEAAQSRSAVIASNPAIPIPRPLRLIQFPFTTDLRSELINFVRVVVHPFPITRIAQVGVQSHLAQTV